MSTLTISIIQSDLHWEDKRANLRQFESKIRSISDKTEVIVLPEMFNTGFSMNAAALAETMEGESVQWMKDMAAEKKAIITGSLIIEEDGNYFNRLIWMLPNGQFGHYDKRHRFAYAGEDQHFTAGTRRLIASVKGWKINLMVCYDLRFPVWARQSRTTPAAATADGSSLEYDVLLYVANWPSRRNTAWTTLLRARAIENQCFVIGVNRVGKDGNDISYDGNSMLIDPLGEILYQKDRAEDIFTTSIDQKALEEARNRFPFWKDADPFLIIT